MAITYYVILSVLTMAGLHGYHIDENNEEDELLDVLQETLMEYMDDNVQVNDPASGYDTWDSSSCLWRNKFHGEDNECWPGYVAVGACQSGKDLDCKDRSTRLYCCRYGKSGGNLFRLQAKCQNVWYGAYAGKNLRCPQGQVVGGLCGSGENKDCNLAGGKSFHHKVLCCTGEEYTVRTNSKNCQWLVNGRIWGGDLICPESQLMVAECGSSSSKNCPYDNKRGLAIAKIRCCPFKLTSTPN